MSMLPQREIGIFFPNDCVLFATIKYHRIFRDTGIVLHELVLSVGEAMRCTRVNVPSRWPMVICWLLSHKCIEGWILCMWHELFVKALLGRFFYQATSFYRTSSYDFPFHNNGKWYSFEFLWHHLHCPNLFFFVHLLFPLKLGENAILNSPSS